ncbi:PREDICTED: aquaporin-4-like [Priapulus caudatus]|uniref:Aquaporin-4-like n=1 Tax=Priapulus caudatus TaxID=37621 RepID=A0ABM1EZJ8_PRICU|nr:PREDICTED: aquaporin-4-like [Priapulus caudatus]
MIHRANSLPSGTALRKQQRYVMSIKLSCCGSLMKSMASIGCFDLWRALLAEFVGTLLLVLLACGSGVHSGADQPAFFNGIVGIALTAGLTVATVVWCVGDVSGAHINPAVTVSMVMTGRIQLLKAVLYVLVQCAGAISGAACLDAVTPASLNSSLSANTLGADVTAGQAFIVEAVVTFLLLLTVCAALDTGRTLGGSAPLAIGIAVIIGHLFATIFVSGYWGLQILPLCERLIAGANSMGDYEMFLNAMLIQIN